jgi:hypothetical protein
MKITVKSKIIKNRCKNVTHLQVFVYKFIFNKISLFLYYFISFFLILTCSCPYSYNLMLTSNCMCRPYIDTCTNNPQGMQLGRFKNHTPARFEYIYCTLFPLCHSNQDMYPFLKDASFCPCFCFVHTIAHFSRILRFSHIYCQIFRIRTHGWRKWRTTALTSTIGSEKFQKIILIFLTLSLMLMHERFIVV